MKKLLLIIALSLSVQSCVFVVGAAAGAAGAAAVYDHRTLKKIIEDQRIENSIAGKLNSTEALRNSHIEVTSFNQIVLLTGQTESAEHNQLSAEIAKSIPGVKRVYNELTVKGSTSTLTRASDTWITTKIKTQMLATKGLKSGTIKVVTENGTTYLMGIVSRKQADIAVEIARQVSGVQRVVKIFQYTDQSIQTDKSEPVPEQTEKTEQKPELMDQNQNDQNQTDVPAEQ